VVVVIIGVHKRARGSCRYERRVQQAEESVRFWIVDRHFVAIVEGARKAVGAVGKSCNGLRLKNIIDRPCFE